MEESTIHVKALIIENYLREYCGNGRRLDYDLLTIFKYEDIINEYGLDEYNLEKTFANAIYDYLNEGNSEVAENLVNYFEHIVKYLKGL